MRINLRLASLFLVLGLASLAKAETPDYPYDDAPTKDDTDLPVEKSENSAAKNSIKKDKSGVIQAPRPVAKRLPALFRMSIKVGGNYSVIQAATVDTAGNVTGHANVSGVGAEALFSAGWDLPYQPVFIEFETGYRGLFLNQSDRLHIAFVGLGLHYRDRVGPTSLWKPGIKTYIEARIQDTTDPDTGAASSEFGIYTTVALSSLFEFGNFLVEPMLYINRIQKDRTFISFATRAGYRF